MDLGSLFSGLGFVPPNNPDPVPGTSANNNSLTNWIIIIIILVVAFRYGNLKSWFSPPVYNNPNPRERKHKKHHKHHKEDTDSNNPYPDYPPPQQPQGFSGLFNGLGV
jgi:hypothetical protein